MAMFVILVLMGLMFPPEVHGVDLEITSFVSNPESPVKDKEGTAENVTLQCQVNLPSTNLTSVTISYPNGVMTNATTTTTTPSPALYEITLSDVHPSHAGNYTCTASASTGSVPTTSQTYQLNVDIDECDSSTCGSNCDTCHTDANCTNTIGSYTCACNAGYNGDGVTCQDIDECDPSCSTNCDTCHTDATCTNTIGSYTCACNAGYSGNGITCQDINECDPSCSTNCDTCDTDATCTNTIGSYTCACNAGYSGNGVTCQDIDECDSSTCGSNCDTCHTDATCTNTMGSYTCACNAGYSGNGVTCQECASNYYGIGCMSACTCVSSGNAVCNKANGSCTCNKQFSEATCDKAMIAISTFEPLNGTAPIRDDSSVNDVNMRCHVNLAETDLLSVFIIFPGSSQNAMTKVQEGVWEYTLQDVHPINSGVYTCHTTANPIPSGRVFDIRRTFNLTVTDVNECDEDLDNCHVNATCTNGIGGFTCMCVNGFTGNGVQCADINECDPSCSTNCDTCHTDATCTNTIGSYTCACNAGYSGDGATCQECVEGKYGFNCAENCTCVDPMPGPNDVMCRKSDGFCECNKAEFIGKTCEKRNLTVTLMPDPNPVLDRPGIDNITWRCLVNLHSRDLVSPVTITNPNGSIWHMNMSEEGLYERIQSGVTPNDNGRYTCTAAAVGMDPVTGHFDLDVLIDGRIISVSDPVEGEVGDTVRISCTVYARSDVDIAWYFGNNQIIDDAKYAITNMSLGDFEQISYLTVHNLIATDNGSYACSATNDTREAMIVVIERPVISNVEISAVSFDQLRVSWVITFDGNLPPPSCHVNYSSTSTGPFMSSPGSPVTDVRHIVTGLQAYTEYYVQVQCTNKVGSSNNLQGGLQRTLKTNPSEPRNLVATDIQPDRFNVVWNEPAMTNGPIDGYKIKVTRQSDGAIIKMAQVTGRSLLVEGLAAYTNYTVVVIAFNTEGGQDLASSPAQQNFTTAQDAPTPPRNVQSINLLDTCNVSWGRPENENGIIQSYKVIYSAYPRPESSENSAIDRDNSGSYNVNGNQMTFVFNKSNHAAYSEFRFNVSATTVAEGNPSDVSNGSCITNPAAPAEGAVSVPLEGAPDDPEEEAITSSSFYMALTPADERNGPISCYNIIVKELSEDESIDGLNPDQDYPQEKVGTYGDSLDNPGQPYIALVKEGTAVSGTQNIKIGSERVTRCGVAGSRRKRQATYDHTGNNGRLKAETRYTAFVRAFVKVGDKNDEVYTSSPFMQPIKTAAGPSVAGIVIGIILAILVIIVIVLGALIYMKRRQTTPLLRGEENGVAMVQVKDKEPEMTHMVVLPIPIEDLEEKVKQKSQNDDEVFKAEFKSIPEATGDVTRDATNLECNKEKNRYINIGAYDQTRVKLSVIDDVEGSDYINACYIDGYEKSRKFIAAQGPREDTVLDFWRMIWEQNCATIIMLTKCLENGREKCAEYWPEEDAIMYDDIIVTLDDVVTCADYVIRKFTMQKHIETEDEEDEDAEPIVGESRTLMQFHFLGWPDFGIPKYPHSMLCFVKRIRHMTGTRIEPGNIVVHCSAGVGRTGTYILIDYMLDMMKKEKKVDIYNVIYSLRSQRNLLVQSLVQYIFIHKALMEEYLYGHTEVDVGSMRHYYQKLCGKASDGEDTGVEKEYRAMASLPVDNTDQKTGNIEANKQKNRLRQVIPYDRNRVKLERLTGQEHSNYINASFIDGYEHKKAYVAAQGPLPNTMGDFWRMAWENQCSTIVMLSECEERGQNVCTKYWPEAGETLNPAFLTVAVKEVKEDDDCTIRDLEVSTTKGAGTKLIRQYHYHGWPEVGIPDNSASLVKVIGLAHEYQQDIGRFPILVHCSAGSGRTGVFIALSYLLQRAKAEGIVDVFQAVRTLRQQRPHMVQDVAQYQFCYRAMNEYLDSFDHYANFK